MSRLANSAGITGPASGGAAAVAAVNPLLAAANPLLAAAPGAVPAILPGGLLAPAAIPAMPGMPTAVPGVMPGAVPGGVDLSLQQGRLGPPSPIPTQCLLLKNMFDVAQQTEPNWVQEITEDVRDECSKYGQVLHTFVDKDSQVGTREHHHDRCCPEWELISSPAALAGSCGPAFPVLHHHLSSAGLPGVTCTMQIKTSS